MLTDFLKRDMTAQELCKMKKKGDQRPEGHLKAEKKKRSKGRTLIAQQKKQKQKQKQEEGPLTNARGRTGKYGQKCQTWY